MILVENRLGHVSDPPWRERARDWRVDHLVVEQWEASRNRLRKTSQGGVELAIALPRSGRLHDGDVLHADEAAKLMVVARVPLKEVMVIELEGLERLAPAEILRAAFELGHGLGNQHWPAVIRGSTVYVPVSVDRKVADSVMRTHAFAHTKTRFAPGEEILALLEPSEARLLFGGGETGHHHHGGHGHHHHQQHHDRGHGHDHVHGHGHHGHDQPPGHGHGR
ncbi:urease accessory protein UreE [Camelimonas abortus]|uniref:Urease accessory protein UreE n=1 Tax=Camelimonas abortus TaxID=1017184 RepID=A0ABV7LBE0_9HYPH